jgi:hypothetical protein
LINEKNPKPNISCLGPFNVKKGNRQLLIFYVVELPMDEFNDMLSRAELTEEQLNLCRDIR